MSSKVRNLVKAPLRERVSAEEWETRVNLAACYRLAAHYRMTDLIYTHISARVPGPAHHFLINAFGQLWDEISASTLVKVTLDGEVVEDPTGFGFNRAGYVIHSAVHRARPDVGCVMHTHTQAGIAVSAQEDGLLPLSQHAMRFANGIAYHDYEGLALDLDEQVRLAPPRRVTLETAIEWIAADELVEVTPKAIRIRKRHLSKSDRDRARKG